MSNLVNKNSRKSAKVTRDDQGFPIDDDFQPVEIEYAEEKCNSTPMIQQSSEVRKVPYNHQGVLLATRTLVSSVEPVPVSACSSEYIPASTVYNHSNCTTCGELDMLCRCDPEYEASLKQIYEDIQDYCTRHNIPIPAAQGYEGHIQTCAILDMIEEERNPKPVVEQHPTELWKALMKLSTTLTPVSAAPRDFNDHSSWAPTAADNKKFDPNEWVLQP
jgi:hypothetical protein